MSKALEDIKDLVDKMGSYTPPVVKIDPLATFISALSPEARALWDNPNTTGFHEYLDKNAPDQFHLIRRAPIVSFCKMVQLPIADRYGTKMADKINQLVAGGRVKAAMAAGAVSIMALDVPPTKAAIFALFYSAETPDQLNEFLGDGAVKYIFAEGQLGDEWDDLAEEK